MIERGDQPCFVEPRQHLNLHFRLTRIGCHAHGLHWRRTKKTSSTSP
nr:MAG TPA: hypothetical protein [Caudoviricetes sp.]